MNKALQLGRKITALLGDLFLMYLGLFLTLIIRYSKLPNVENWHNHWTTLSGLFIVWLFIFYAFGLYQKQSSKQKLDLIRAFLPAIGLCLIIGIAYFYLLAPSTNITPKTSLLILTLIFGILFLIFSFILSKVFSNSKFYRRVLLIGYHPLLQEILPANGQKRFEFIFKGLVNNERVENWPNDIRIYSLDQLEAVIRQEKIDLLIISPNLANENTTALFKIMPLKVSFVTLTNFYEWVFKKIPLNIVDRTWFLDNLTEGDKKIFETIKRFIDILLSLIGLIIASPIMLLVACAIALNSKGEIIFKQVRLGLGGQEFSLYKFRTMFQNAEKNGAEWAKVNDPRITGVGKFLRKTRLDEIPQLLNILKGKMSFVGPRPERPEFVTDLTQKIPFYQERLLVKPGLTGWAQILGPAYGGSVEESLNKLQYDLYYIKHRNIFLDFAVIIKTLSIVTKMLGR